MKGGGVVVWRVKNHVTLFKNIRRVLGNSKGFVKAAREDDQDFVKQVGKVRVDRCLAAFLLSTALRTLKRQTIKT